MQCTLHSELYKERDLDVTYNIFYNLLKGLIKPFHQIDYSMKTNSAMISKTHRHACRTK